MALETRFLTDSLWSVWANHGDDISIQYSGTPALKGDFVRYLLMNFSKAFHFPQIKRILRNYDPVKVLLY